MNNSSDPNTANKFARPTLLTAGKVLQQRYRIVRELGFGGMGAVYEAIDSRLEIKVAIKETFSDDRVLRRQFEHEARLLAQLNHSALPRVSDYFAEDGRAFLVMQFISGADLAQAMSIQRGPFPKHQVIAWADQLLDVLVYLHTRDRQIIHRDIKPHNLKLTESGQLALLDFGLAKTHPDQSSTETANSIFGYTRRYSPLEQIQDQGTSPQSDIYALGATLYHLLTGNKPPDALTRAAALADGKPDPLVRAHLLHKSVGSDLADILNTAMAMHAVDRFETAEAFRETLRHLGRQEIRSDADGASSRRNDPTALDANINRRLDRFATYAILNPEEDPLSTTRSKRATTVILALVAILLIILSASYPRNVAGIVMKFFATSWNGLSHNPTTDVIRARRSEADTRPAEINSTVVPAADISHKTARRRRRNSPKPEEVKPPPISIAPGEIGYSLP